MCEYLNHLLKPPQHTSVTVEQHFYYRIPTTPRANTSGLADFIIFPFCACVRRRHGKVFRPDQKAVLCLHYFSLMQTVVTLSRCQVCLCSRHSIRASTSFLIKTNNSESDPKNSAPNQFFDCLVLRLRRKTKSAVMKSWDNWINSEC